MSWQSPLFGLPWRLEGDGFHCQHPNHCQKPGAIAGSATPPTPMLSLRHRAGLKRPSQPVLAGDPKIASCHTVYELQPLLLLLLLHHFLSLWISQILYFKRRERTSQIFARISNCLSLADSHSWSKGFLENFLTWQYLNASAIPWFSEISRAIFLLLLAVLSEITNRVTFFLEPPRRFTPYKIPTGIGPYYPEGPLYSPLGAFDCHSSVHEIGSNNKRRGAGENAAENGWTLHTTRN